MGVLNEGVKVRVPSCRVSSMKAYLIGLIRARRFAAGRAEASAFSGSAMSGSEDTDNIAPRCDGLS